MNLKTTNPATGQAIDEYKAMTDEQVWERISAASNIFQIWRHMQVAQRTVFLEKAASLLEKEKERYANLMATEMGKPIRDGRAEIEKCAWLCRHVAQTAEDALAPEPADSDARKSYVAFPPLGIVLGVMPWNYPFWQVFRFAVPAMTAGNAVLLKHASAVPGCSLAIEALMLRAGFPRALFHSLLIPSGRVASVIDDRRVSALALTGSKTAGSAVAEQAGRLIKKTVLELGGSDPYIILEDADLDAAVAACVSGRLLNSGQSCIAAKRFIVAAGIRRRFETQLVEGMKAVRMGDPLEEETDVGPLAREDLRETLHRQVGRSVDMGARCLLGGEIPQGKGFFYPPTVLTDVRRGMPVFEEETFGPVAAVVPAEDENEAVRLANATDFGLGAAVFTQDIARGERIAAERLEAGNCFVNAFVKSDPRLPFGGIKESGYGRELSHYGIKEFVNIKTVYVD